MILILTAAVVILITAVYLYFKQKWAGLRKDLEQRNIPYATMPSLFSVFFLKKRIERIQEEKVRENGKIFGFIQMNIINIILAEPELIQLVLSKEFTNFPNRRASIFFWIIFIFIYPKFSNDRNSTPMIQYFPMPCP